MSVKKDVLCMLEENRGSAVSGEELAGRLGVSRAAVWKAVRALCGEGYRIDSGKNKGYTLAADCDRIFEAGIRRYIREAYADCRIDVLDTVDSTNNYAKRVVAEGKLAEKRMLVTANEQTAGRGRMGRSFFSPADTGIYMTAVMHAGGSVADFLPVTVAAAVAVTRMIELFTDEKPQIKWVNDVWVGDKKVCGILTEGITGLEAGTLDTVIVGIGINVDTAKAAFPDDVRKVAASLKTAHVTRNRMIASVTNELFSLSENLKDPALMQEYREKSLILGKPITWTEQGVRREGIAAAINDAGNLEVETENGRVVLGSGEVSIRPAAFGEH